MFKQNRSNTRDKTVEIPVMNSSEIAAVWSQRAEATGSRQFFREDGSPLIGATYPLIKNIGAKLKKNRNKQKLKKNLGGSMILPAVPTDGFSGN